MIEILGLAITTFFATISPFSVSAVFAALSSGANTKALRAMAIRGVVIAAVILLCFAFFGELLLSSFGISLAALRTSGGILLLLIGIENVFAKTSGAISTIKAENQEAVDKVDISIFPLATPLIAGPGAIGAIILLMADAGGDITNQILVVVSLLLVLLLTLIILLSASTLQKKLGVTGMHVIGRIMGVLLSALAVQFIFDGIKQSGLFSV